MRNFLFKKFILFSKKGFTLVELILALAILSILAVGVSAAMSYGSDFYVKNRKYSQATSFANDIINGINGELYTAYGAYIENELNTGQGASLSFSADAKYAPYGRRIFLDTSTYTVVCQNKDGTATDSLKSRYQKGLYVKNLMFEVKHNPAYDVDGVESSGMFDASVDNILTFSFQIYDDETLKLLYEVKDFSIVLDNMVSQINSPANITKSASELKAMLKIGKGEIDDYNKDLLDFDAPANLNSDMNLTAKYYNMLYFDIDAN